MLSGVIDSTTFVTDFDGTLAHYDPIPLDESDNYIALPASSGSKKVGYISNITKDLLYRISSKSTVICASGMRFSTLQQRYPFLQNAVNYWICENGGRILQYNESKELEEMPAYVAYKAEKEAESGSQEALRTFRIKLKEIQGLTIDTTGYKTMIRIKYSTSEHLDQVLGLIPSNLRYTHNLGYLDVHLVYVGKYQAISWLLNYINELSGYIYMGDDDNDIEAMSHADIGLIMNPCSQAMQDFIRHHKPISSAKVNGFTFPVELQSQDSYEFYEETLGGMKLIKSISQSHTSTINLLTLVCKILRLSID